MSVATGSTSNSPGGGLVGRNRMGERVLRAGQTSGDRLVGIMLVIVIASAIAYVGVDVTEEIDDTIDVPNSLSNNDSYNDAKDNISGGFTDAVSLIDIVFLVLMFSVILGALLAFRTRAG